MTYVSFYFKKKHDIRIIFNHLEKIKDISCIICEHRLKGDSIFCSLVKEDLEGVSKLKRSTLYKKGHLIFNEGNQAHGIYCILSGKVKIHKLGDEGKEQIVRFAKDSDLIGYRSVLSNDTYYASATAIEDSQVCFIPKATILSLVKTNPNLSISFINLLSENLKQAEEKVMNMAQKHVRERIADALILLIKVYGYKDDGKTLNTSLTRREIANIAGTTTETSIRVLSDFQQDGMITLNGKDIAIVNKTQLINTANANYH